MASMRPTINTGESWETTEDSASNVGSVVEGEAAHMRFASGQHLDRLMHTIEADIIPRLLLAHRTNPASPFAGKSSGPQPNEDDVKELTRLVLAEDADVALAFVEAICKRGAEAEAVYLDLLAPCARHLGELWKADVCDFVQVTIGLGRLQTVLREMSRRDDQQVGIHQDGRRALLAPAPGEQHMFGILIVAEFMRRSNWDIRLEPVVAGDALAAIVAGEWFALVGLSASSESHLDKLAKTIAAIRRTSRNPSVGIMVGGLVFAEHPELADAVQADATAVDGEAAAKKAELLLDRASATC